MMFIVNARFNQCYYNLTKYILTFTPWLGQAILIGDTFLGQLH